MVTFFTPGLRFFHQGQLQGRHKRISPHLCRGPDEPADSSVLAFYLSLLEWLQHPAFREGDWQLLDCVAAWQGNKSWDNFIASAWQGQDGARLLVAVNYAPHQSQCCVRIPFEDLRGGQYRLVDWTSFARYDRDGDELLARGLYLDMPPWGYHLFELQRTGPFNIP